MEYQENFETMWLLGIWGADHGTLAKGVVALVNTKPEILATFRRFSLKNFDIRRSKFRQRTLRGYGISTEIYFTRLPVRRFLESLLSKREKISKNKMLPYFAGRFDGDGNADAKMSTEKKIIRLRILQPRSFSAKVLPYVVHKNKRQQLKLIIRKRSYGS